MPLTLPTAITLARLLIVPVIVGLLSLNHSAVYRWWGVGLFLVAALTDWLDGYIARRLNQVTDLGKVLDPLVDKLLILVPLLLCIEWGEVPAWSVALILFRELGIASWRVQQSQIQGANLWGKAKTLSQIMAVALLLAPLPPSWQGGILIVYGGAIALTLISGALYLRG
ncbi:MULTISPECIES: CDP-diacylglycerol--glycerol-3-phosphate 3-phosphatidyltransferase [unclassified Thermosynechococcus]|uniref:CDP-diacylglycerol--glycerol-3-phosphate 3-phosphatidyltransferase n=1 Tax=unclassified Thermosynechococcus TaxID=2622553 RepID=UPI002673E9F2|nr:MULTISPECIES: CDP-diacylglycerol--glycerol-3-phosphate 3-phosphatidyltransferase [unclassified Thermosynechococcus]WKT80117.1 CDP-diacylglycerol--glycerol-3-phosphate 3-phosphatidyltransferase [Thermosynechococcus sp. PP45]WNC23727.1 CDP-diacylglycerol--glycerol-3-phosphate 3-phosphatidyltransferase [Thermosynechococcus sp. PP551]WNC26303.1 CDP-diacylglycerol--glycerol-3-phosphate 3-phosphatidyltransferase [Thermosynechococcus sp. PP555]WNC44046.1 CDP-diacylglycerol--glycerol-3-phosphate 3-p